MRSNYGSKNLLFSILSITLLYSLALDAGEYLISYRYVVKNASLYNESFYVSKAMTKCVGIPQKSITLETYENKDLKSILSLNNEKFIKYLENLGTNIKYNNRSLNFQSNTSTILTIKTTCFKVDINENLAKITLLK